MSVEQGDHATSYLSRFGAMSYIISVDVSRFLSVHVSIESRMTDQGMLSSMDD